MQWNTELMRHTWREEGSAPFRDPDIRSSCMEILNGEGNYDQAVMAACKVLEARVRVASGAPASQRSGVQLMHFAFGGDKPPLRLSSEASEQRGAMEMYAGLMSYLPKPCRPSHP